MTAKEEPPVPVKEGDKIVDQAMGQLAEKLGEANPELALKPDAPKSNNVKMAVDYGPLIVMFLTFLACRFLKLTPEKDALIWASGALGIASIVALVTGLIMEKRLAWIPLISCIFTIPFSALTVIFHDGVFVKIKMTIVDFLIGGVLLGALAIKKQPLKALLGDALKLKDEAWPRLTVYYALFYFAMGATNEVIWRTQSDGFWLTWKMVSIIGGPVAFSIVLLPFMMKNLITEETPKA